MKINICKGNSCSDKFSHYMFTRLKNDIERFNLKNLIIDEVECIGDCTKGPNVQVDGNIMHNMNPTRISKIALNNNKKNK